MKGVALDDALATSRATRARTTWGCTTSGTPTAARCSASRARTASSRSARARSGGRVRPDLVHAAHVPERRGRPGGDRRRPALPSRVPARRPEPDDHARAGDVVLTGTPANSRPMRPGDVVEVEIAGLGRLTNEIVEWDVDLAGPGEQLQVSARTLHVALAIPEDEAERRVRGRVDPPRPHRPRRAAGRPARRGTAVGRPARARRARARRRPCLPRVGRRAVLARAMARGEPGSTTSASAPRRVRAGRGDRPSRRARAATRGA